MEKTLMLTILVEGHTEQAILKPFLKPYWSQRFRECIIHNLGGSGRFTGKGIPLIERWLNVRNQAVLVLLDTHNDSYNIFKQTSDPTEQFERLQRELYKACGREEQDNFAIFPVVQEVETWLLADYWSRHPTAKNKHSAPEHIENPTKTFKDYHPHYKKGKGAEKYIRADSAKNVYDDNCPHFRHMVHWLVGKQGQP